MFFTSHYLVHEQAIYGLVLAFGDLADKATASLAMAVVTRTVALQVYQISERWQAAVLQAIVAARVAVASFAELGSRTAVQEAHDIEESLVQIYSNRSAIGGSSVMLQKLSPSDVAVRTFEGIMDYL